MCGSTGVSRHFEDKRAQPSFDGWHNNVTGGTSLSLHTETSSPAFSSVTRNFKYSMVVGATPTSLNGGRRLGRRFTSAGNSTTGCALDGICLTYSPHQLRRDRRGLFAGSFGADRITGMSKLSGTFTASATFFLETVCYADHRKRTAGFVHRHRRRLPRQVQLHGWGVPSTGGTIGTPIAVGTMHRDADLRRVSAIIVSAMRQPPPHPSCRHSITAGPPHVNGGACVERCDAEQHITASATGRIRRARRHDPILARAKGSLGVKF